MRKKRWVSFCLLAALALGLMIPSVFAEDTVFFTAVNNSLLELTAETMPVNHNSLIYVPCSVFNTRALDTWAYYSRSGQTVLISDGEKELYFDMSAGNSRDREENSYRYAAIYLNDTAYVPAFFVADYFGLRYSYIRRENRHIVRITKGSVLSDEEFFNAAASLMETRLNQYLGSQETAAPLPSTAPSPAPTQPLPTSTPAPTPEPSPAPTPDTAGPSPSPEVTPTPNVDRSDVRVRLCFLGLGSGTAELLDELGDTPACFFATAEEIYGNADLTRRILGSGSAVGLRVLTSPAEEFDGFRRAMGDTAMCASLLCCAVGFEEETVESWGETGLCLLRGEAPLASAAECAAVLENTRSSVSLLLTGDFRELQRLLRLLERDHYTLEAVTEVTAGR